MRIELLGTVGVEGPDGRRVVRGRAAVVLAYLVLERGRAVPREELADAVWADHLPATTHTSWHRPKGIEM